MGIVLRLLRGPLQHFPCRTSPITMQSAEYHGCFQTHSDDRLENSVLELYSDQRQVTNVGTDDSFLLRNLPSHFSL